MNSSKSFIHSSKNKSRGKTIMISSLINLKRIRTSGKHLGLSLIFSKSKYKLHFLVDKVQARLTSWKSKLLSEAGKLTLI